MADLFRTWSSGQPFRPTAEWLNLMNEVGKDFMRRKRFADPGNLKTADDTVLRIKNNSGGDIAQYAIAGIGAKVVGPSGADTSSFGQIAFDSTAPVQGLPFAILQEPGRDGDLCKAIADGVTLCKVALSSLTHGYADCASSDYAALASQAAPGPATILWADDGAANQLNGAINNSVTTIVLDSTAAFPSAPFVILIGTEQLNVTDVDDDGVTLTVTRGYNSTSAASHADNAVVTFFSGTVWAYVLLSGNYASRSIIAHTAASFTIPAVAATATVTVTSAVDTSIWMVVGQTVEIYDGSHQVYGYITAIADATHFTFKTTRVALGSAGNTMASQAQVIISGDPAGGGSSPPDWAVGVDGIMNNVAQSGYGEKTSVDNGSGGWKVIASSGSNHFAKLGFNGLIVDLDSGSPGVDYANHDYRTMSFFTSISAAIYSQTGILYQDSPGSGPTNSIKLEFNPFVSPASVTLRGAGFLNPATAAWSAIPTYVAGNAVYVIDATTGKRQGYKANATNTNDDPALMSGNWDAFGYEPSFNIRDGAAVTHYGKTIVVPLAKITGGGADGSITITGGVLTDYVLPT